MELDKDFTVKHDGNCWVLEKNQVTDRINKKTGKHIEVNDRWYYPMLKQALRKYMNESLVDNNGIEEVLTRLNEVEETINKISIK